MSTTFTTDAQQALDHLDRELRTIRTGRANPAVLEDLRVEAYGTATPLVQLAAITAPEPRLLVVQPWDPSVVKDIEKALSQSSLGISPVVDGKIIRLPFPAMTEERRQQLVKMVNEKGEESRVRIRGLREQRIKDLRQSEKDGQLSEDGLAAELKTLQTEVDTVLEQVAEQVHRKHEELSAI